jgi:hypothetical protein
MENNKFKNSVDQFLNPKTVKSVSTDGKEEEVCDLQTGECYVLRSKDGIVERINKKYITEVQVNEILMFGKENKA